MQNRDEVMVVVAMMMSMSVEDSAIKKLSRRLIGIILTYLFDFGHGNYNLFGVEIRWSENEEEVDKNEVMWCSTPVEFKNKEFTWVLVKCNSVVIRTAIFGGVASNG